MNAFHDEAAKGISPDGLVELDETTLGKIAGGLESGSKKEGAASQTSPSTAPGSADGGSKKKDATMGTPSLESQEATLRPSSDSDSKKKL